MYENQLASIKVYAMFIQLAEVKKSKCFKPLAEVQRYLLWSLFAHIIHENTELYFLDKYVNHNSWKYRTAFLTDVNVASHKQNHKWFHQFKHLHFNNVQEKHIFFVMGTSLHCLKIDLMNINNILHSHIVNMNQI